MSAPCLGRTVIRSPRYTFSWAFALVAFRVLKSAAPGLEQPLKFFVAHCVYGNQFCLLFPAE
jgi:hypothetical protein